MEEEEFISYLLERGLDNERTIKAYLGFYRLFCQDAISQSYINEFILRHHNTSIVRAFIKHFLERSQLSNDYTLPKKSIGRKSERVIRSISTDEIKLMSNHFNNLSVKSGLIFDMLYQGALRRFEITTITLGSFYWHNWLLNPSDFCKLLIKGKGKKQRIVLINPETMQKILEQFVLKYNLEEKQSIEDFMKRNGDALLFASEKNNKLLHDKYVYNLLKKQSLKVIGRDVRPHELRHCRATELEKKGIPIRDIGNYLGHSKIATTEIYLHKSGEESLDTIMKALKF